MFLRLEPLLNPMLRGGCLAALVLVCLSTTGCVRRRMTIRSYPPGAQVFVDDQEIGTTPCSTSYIYYGKRNIMLVKDGYKTERFVQQFEVPWYEYMPLDFINENLNPNEIRDESNIEVTLQPQENVPQEKLLERANNMRSGARLGLVTPLPDVPNKGVLPKMGVPGQGLPGGEPIPYQSLPAPFTGPTNTIPGTSLPGTPLPAAPPPNVPAPGVLGPPASTIPPNSFIPPLPNPGR
jgi:hypothetical protein